MASMCTNGHQESATYTADEPVAGILTKTLVLSPVIRWILHARIRDRRYNDVAFIGDDFIRVMQVKEGGHLEQIAVKSDLDARIRAARVFSIDSDISDGDDFMKFEYDLASDERIPTPPQCVVLTLDSNELLFICLVSDTMGGYRFIHQSCPLPVFDRLLFQPGEHLAVDVESRALAVAANEREVIIYSAKPEDAIKADLQDENQDWTPIAAQRPLQIEGVIIHMEFLVPSANDHEHIILLLLVVDRGKTRATWIDWYQGTDLHDAQIHQGTPLDDMKSVPNLLIPLRNAGFFLVHGAKVKRWDNLLCGSPTGITIDMDIPMSETLIPGASPRHPSWVNWCRPRRTSQDIEQIYLIREDGVVAFVRVARTSADACHAGDFNCHAGSTFASLGDDRYPDILAAAGDMSTGGIQSIGRWPSPKRMSDPMHPSRQRDMEMTQIETIPNWASVTDMVTTSFAGKSQRPRDAVFVTSGRQPYGSVTELRKGLEARSSVVFELDGLRSSTDIWALPLVAIGQVLIVLSSPSSTRFVKISTSAETAAVEELNENSLALDASSQTLAASAIADGSIVQITTNSICITPGTSANFEDVAKIDYADGPSIICADIDTSRSPSQSMALTAGRSERGGYALASHALHTGDMIVSSNDQIKKRDVFRLKIEPLGLYLLPHPSASIAFVTSTDGYLSAYKVEEDGRIKYLTQSELPDKATCDNIAVLCHPRGSAFSNLKHLVVCGLRDGRLHAVVFNTESDPSFEESTSLNFSQSTVKLKQPGVDRSITGSTAYAMSGLDFCLLSWDGSNASSLHVESIWVSDKERPELAQGHIVACAHMPEAPLLSSPDLAGNLVVVSEDEVQIASLERKQTIVPRQMPVSGTPNRLIYAEQQRCLVCASQCYDVHSFPRPGSKPEERRQVWPVIDFIPARSSKSSITHKLEPSKPSFTYHMQPGERVYALLEWSFRLSNEEDKRYSFILVGGSYFKSNGSLRGRITFLQPVNKDWAVQDVKEGRTTNFDAPVYALALLDDLTYVACVGQNVVVSRFNVEDRKWNQLCKPLKLASPGIYITVFKPDSIDISTSQDSFVSVRITPNDGGDDEYAFHLVPMGMAPRAENLLSHLTPVYVSPDGVAEALSCSLMATKAGQITALRTYEYSTAATILFSAQLPRSLTRLRQCSVRPRWKPQPPRGVMYDDFIGCAPDGSLVGIALLGQSLLRKLSWIQRLCEWSAEISPHSYKQPVYSVAEQSYARDERLMPIGLSDHGSGEVVMRTTAPKLVDGHIDGDILVRLLEKRGEEALRRVIEETARRDDRAGAWVRKHFEQEIEAVEGIVSDLRRVLDCWI